MFWTQTIALQTRCEETRYDLVSQNFEDVSSMMKTNGIRRPTATTDFVTRPSARPYNVPLACKPRATGNNVLAKNRSDITANTGQIIEGIENEGKKTHRIQDNGISCNNGSPGLYGSGG